MLYHYNQEFIVMSKYSQRKSDFICLTFEQEKQNNPHSQNESMLVSSLRERLFKPVQEMPSFSQKRVTQQKLNQSVISRKNTEANVILEEKADPSVNAHSCKNCLNKIDKITDKIQSISLKIEQIQANIKILYSKNAQASSKNFDIEKIYTQIKYLSWQNQQQLRDYILKNDESNRDKNEKIQSIQKDIEYHRKILTKYEKMKEDENACYDSRRLQQKFETQKFQTDEKLNKMVEALKQMGKLQKQIINSEQFMKNPNQTTDIRRKSSKSFTRSYFKRNLDESTHISFSRNTDFDIK